MADRKRPRPTERESSPFGRSDDDDRLQSDAFFDPDPADDDLDNDPAAEVEEFEEVDDLASIPDADQLNLEDEEGEGEDLFGDGMERDYRDNPELDRFDERDIDDEQYDEIDPEARMIAEERMRRRDREEARRNGNLPAAFMDDDDDDDTARPNTFRRRTRNEMESEMDFDDPDADLAPTMEGLAEVRGPFASYVTMEGPKQAIKREFTRFLTTFTNDLGESVYGNRIKAMCEANGESLEVSFMDLQGCAANLAMLLTNCPAEILKIFDVVAFEVTTLSFPNYDQIKSEIHVRITDLVSIDSIRDLRQSDMNKLVRVSGVVTRRTGVFPQLKYVKFNCAKCGTVLGPFCQDAVTEVQIKHCYKCQSKGPFNLNSEETIYRNFQKISLQECPGKMTAGRLPRHKDVILLWDLVDMVRPGEEVEITGIYRNNMDMTLNSQHGFPIFSTVIEANHILKQEDAYASFRLHEEDMKSIDTLSKDPRIRERIIKSIAPSIYGHSDIKTAMALAMFGGVAKNPQGKHRLRGDINVLLLGDPGTAKSQFLKYVEKTGRRAVFTTGQGASAVGLTASVHKDFLTREWTLEGGALVMADKGVCLIDEFDKMNDKDRTSIHEAMEQQSISISKAGIVTSLQARCAVIAAANPIRGRYNPMIPFSMNVELTEPILSRFDILCVVRDEVDPIADEKLARFVTSSHMRSHPATVRERKEAEENMEEPADAAADIDPDIIPQELLRKYIVYARDRVHPRIADVDRDKIANLYAELRRQSLVGGSVPITVRYLESVVRMAEAFAKMHLRDFVRSDDIDHAIAVMIRSFVDAQKKSVKDQLRRKFDKYITADRDKHELLLHLLSERVRDLVRQHQLERGELPRKVDIDLGDFQADAAHVDVQDIRPFLKSNEFRKSFTVDFATKIIRMELRRRDEDVE